MVKEVIVFVVSLLTYVGLGAWYIKRSIECYNEYEYFGFGVFVMFVILIIVSMVKFVLQ